MTIQEAIKSQKPIRRSEWGKWYVVRKDRLCEMDESPTRRTIVELYVSDIVADDWEVKEE